MRHDLQADEVKVEKEKKSIAPGRRVTSLLPAQLFLMILP